MRHKAIASLLRQLMPELRSQPNAATVSVNVGMVDGGKGRGWLFGPGIDNELTAEGLADRVRRIAPPFMRRLANDPTAFEELIDGTHVQRATMLPLVMLAQGRTAEATRFVEETRRELPERGQYKDFYCVFAERVARMVEAAESRPAG